MEWMVEIHQIDVNRGDSTLIVVLSKDKNDDEYTEKKTVLIDCGLAENQILVANYIYSNIDRDKIDIFILSHNHTDHIGHIGTTNPTYKPKEKLSEKVLKKRTEIFDRFFPSITDAVKYHNKTQSRTGFSVPPLNEDILKLNDKDAPTLKCIAYLKSDDSDQNDCENRSSLCFILEFGKYKYYTGGDKDGKSEDTLSDIIGKIDFFKVAHHGSEVAASEEFLKNTKPLAAFISAGNDDKTSLYSHPRASCLKRLSIDKNAPKHTFLTSLVKADDDDYKSYISPMDKGEQKTKVRIAGKSKAELGYRGNLMLRINSPTKEDQLSCVTYYDECVISDYECSVTFGEDYGDYVSVYYRK